MSELGPSPGGDVPGVPGAGSWRWQEMALALGALAALLGVVIVLRSHLETFVHAKPGVGMDTTAIARERRGTRLAGLLRAGLVAEVDSAGESPRVFLGPRFEALPTDRQLETMHTIYDAFYPGRNAETPMLLVYTAGERRLIGSYSPPHGLTLEE